MKGGFIRKILYNNLLLRIISLAAAVVFWFMIVTMVSPEYRRTLTGVKISVTDSSASLAAMDFHVIETSTKQVSIDINGPRNIIGRLTDDDVTITPAISAVSKAGTYTFKLNAVLKTIDNRIHIARVVPSTVKIRIDKLVTGTLPVNVKVQDNSIPDGYLLQTAQANPSQITISGPLAEMNSVYEAAAYVTVGSNVTGTYIVNSSVVLLDEKGKKLNLPHLQLSNTSVNVTVPILATRNMPLDVSFYNIPKGFNRANLSYDISPKTIMVAGEDKASVLSVSGISLGKIDFTKIGLSEKKTFTIPVYGNFMNVRTVTSATVTVRLKNTATRLMHTKSFKILNEPSGYTVQNQTTQITGIRLFGPTSNIASVKSVTAVINMSGVKGGTGQHVVPLSFTIPGKTGYWVEGSYKAVVKLVKK
jgi:YbbR domain-containing protein